MTTVAGFGTGRSAEEDAVQSLLSCHLGHLSQQQSRGEEGVNGWPPAEEGTGQ